mmetsp:Transcript_3394/g.13705  ORF Transcript_3394/g.13705 Transcript_3394/m.13705 type:complete len:266 (+) Transcript_3394:121-918(+)
MLVVVRVLVSICDVRRPLAARTQLRERCHRGRHHRRRPMCRWHGQGLHEWCGCVCVVGHLNLLGKSRHAPARVNATRRRTERNRIEVCRCPRWQLREDAECIPRHTVDVLVPARTVRMRRAERRGCRRQRRPPNGRVATPSAATHPTAATASTRRDARPLCERVHGEVDALRRLLLLRKHRSRDHGGCCRRRRHRRGFRGPAPLVPQNLDEVVEAHAHNVRELARSLVLGDGEVDRTLRGGGSRVQPDAREIVRARGGDLERVCP